jgi:hypothetical protein
LNVLDSEISNIRDTETRQGWTSWGLVGGIIGALWLLSDEFKQGKLQLEVVCTSVLLFSTLIDAIRWIVFLLSQRQTVKEETARFRWSNELFAGSELVFIIEIVRSIGLLVLAYIFASSWWLSTVGISVAYGWYILLATSWLILSVTEFPIRERMTKLGATFILLFIIPSIISFVSLLSIAPQPIGEVTANYRVGGLLVAISYLIALLAVVTKESPILQSLARLRRNIAFNRLDPDAAVQQAEIAISGTSVADSVQREVNSILTLVDKLNQTTDNLVSQIQTMKSHFPATKDSKEVVVAKIKILYAHQDTYEFMVGVRKTIENELSAKFQQLMKRRSRVVSVIPEASNFFDKLDDGMKIILEEADRKYASSHQQAVEYDEQLKAVSDTLKLNLNV